MPIPVPCPGCRSELLAPNDWSGRKVKCPDCGMVLVVPSAPARARRSFDDDPPRSPVVPLLIACGLIGVIFLAAAGVGAMYYAGKAKKETAKASTPEKGSSRVVTSGTELEPVKPPEKGYGSGGSVDSPKAVVGGTKGGGMKGVGKGGYSPPPDPKTATNWSPPTGWRRYTVPGGDFRMSLPAAPTRMANETKDLTSAGVSGAMYTAQAPGGGVSCAVGYFNLPTAVTGAMRTQFADAFIDGMSKNTPGAQLTGRRQVTTGGHPSTEVLVTGGSRFGTAKGQVATRLVLVDSRAYVLMIGGDSGRASTAEERGFFDSFELSDDTIKPLK